MRTQKRWKRGHAGLALLLCAGLLFGKFAMLAPAVSQAAQEGKIIASSLYVRSGPSTSYSKMTVNGQDVYLVKNTEVEILGEEDGWYKVKATFSGKEVTGYVSGKYVSTEVESTVTPTPRATATPSAKPAVNPGVSSGEFATEFSVPGQIWVTELNIRETPGTSGALLDTLKTGAHITVLGTTYAGTEKWYKVSYQSGGRTVTGYAYAPYVTLNAPLPTATPKPIAPPDPTKAPVQAEGNYATEFSVPAKVSASVVNVRSGAGTSHDLISSLRNGATMTATGITSADGETWYRISFTENGVQKEGYVFGRYVTLNGAIPTATPVPTKAPEPTKAPDPTKAPAQVPEDTGYAIPAKVSATELNFRKEAGTDSEVLKLLVRDDAVTVIGEVTVGSDVWYYMNVDGVKGYAISNYIVLDYTNSHEATLKEQVRLRSEASSSASYVKTEAGALAVLKKGSGVMLLSELKNASGKWYKLSADLNGETVEGYAQASAIALGAPEEKEPTQAPKPTDAPTPTPEIKPTTAPKPTTKPTTTPKPTTKPTVTPKPTKAPTAAPDPTATPSAEAKENTAGVQVGWGHAKSEKSSTMVMKQLPKSGVGSVKEEGSTKAVVIRPKDYLMLYGLYADEKGNLYRHVGIVEDGIEYYGYILENSITPCDAPSAPAPDVSPDPNVTPKPAIKSWTEAKQETKGEQRGWGHAIHPNASSMIMKLLPKSGVGSVKSKDASGGAVTVTSDTYLMLYDLYQDEKGNLYRHVGVTVRNTEYYGYILEERIKECEAPGYAVPTPGLDIWGDQNDDQEVSADFELNLKQQNFPDSYKMYLRSLHAKYPNWVFKAFHTGLDWDTAIREENIPGKNLIPNSSGIAWKSLEEGAYNWKTDSFIVYDGSTWVTASKAALEYYMDPRNFLDEKSVFQFEVLTYEPSYQDLEGIENILKYTPLYKSSYVYKDDNGNLQTISYGETFIKAAEYSGVSPYHLATRVKQEVITGTTTVSNSVTGTVDGFEGLYNFYNIGAYHSTKPGGAIANGLKYAKYGRSNDDALNDASLIPWDNRYRAIVGGSYIIGDSYINRGQNTIYLQKFNMTSTYTYSHQYMANVVAPSSEGKKTAQAYAGAADSPIVFSIPVFFNMPERACPAPSTAYNPNNYLSKLSVESFDGKSYKLTPSFDGVENTLYSLIVDNSAEVVNIKATAVSAKAVIDGDGYHELKVGRNEFKICVIAEDGSKREYVLYVVRE